MTEAANQWRDRTLLLKSAADAGLDVELPGPGLTVGRAGSPVTVTLWIDQTPWLRVTPPQLAQAAGLPETAHRVPDLGALSEVLVRIARVADTPPPQAEALGQLRALPSHTEVERQVRARVGQDLFRRLLLQAHQGRCAVTGLRHPRLLRASHIKPWAECDTDEERLDPANGLLLAAQLDAAFDAHLITFDRAGHIVLSSELPEGDRAALGLHAEMAIGPVSEARWAYLEGHWRRVVGGG